MLQNDLFPIRADNVNRLAMLDETVKVRTGATKDLSKENDTRIAKIGWLTVTPKRRRNT